jgi:aspartokinase-like uncharacterized kinase
MSGDWQRGVVVAGPVTGMARAVVLKLGGSLLTLPNWPDRIADLVDDVRRTTPRLIVVVGGGPPVDGLRAIDAAAPQSAELMDRLAIESLRLSATLVAASLSLPRSRAPGRAAPACVLDAAGWLSGAGRRHSLPVGWQVTSDSIAAAVATANRADLLLAKRVPPPGPASDLESLAAAGWVDEHFPTAARGLGGIGWAAPG